MYLLLLLLIINACREQLKRLFQKYSIAMKINWIATNVLFIHITQYLCSPLTGHNKTFVNIKLERIIKEYRPVVIIPGLMSDEENFQTLKALIQKEHSGTYIHICNSLLGLDSLFYPMWRQVEIIHKEIEPIMMKSKNGINIIGFSQGALIARGIVESKNHVVRNFISLSSPQAGQYGDVFLDFINMTKSEAYSFFYSKHYQDSYSVPGYWNDPHHQEEYLQRCQFLPRLNNEVAGARNEIYRQNFIQLSNLILIGGPQDGVIFPWQSSHFGFYDSAEKVVDLRNRTVYTQDLFGLRTLDARGRVHILTMSNITHMMWHSDPVVLRDAILPWLD